MSTFDEQYFTEFAAAFVLGRLAREGRLSDSDQSLRATAIADLPSDELDRLIELGKQSGLKLHKFKKTMGLARVRRVLGILHSLQPAELLDVGSGRGAFLWPLLTAFPSTPVTCIDCNSVRVHDILAVRDGGISRLNALEADITKVDLPSRSFDVVTFLEALEHIDEAQAALNNVLRIARRSVVLSMPSHEDDNPEHIHLFSKDSLTQMLSQAGAHRVNVEYVPNHIIVVANVCH